MQGNYEKCKALGLTTLLWLLKNFTEEGHFHYKYNKKLSILELTFNLKYRDCMIYLSCTHDELPMFLYEILGIKEK